MTVPEYQTRPRTRQGEERVVTWIESQRDRLSTAAAIYRYEGNTEAALKLEAILSRLDANRPVRVVDLEAADALAWAVINTEEDSARLRQELDEARRDLARADLERDEARMLQQMAEDRAALADGDVGEYRRVVADRDEARAERDRLAAAVKRYVKYWGASTEANPRRALHEVELLAVDASRPVPVIPDPEEKPQP